MTDVKRCAVCGTKLSSYNNGPNCYSHTEGMPVKTHHPVSICWSKNDPDGHDHHKFLGVDLPDPAFDPQRHAFTQSISGVVVDGDVEPIEIFLGFK